MMGHVVKAMLFDVQGTATDFHSTVCDEAQRISAGRYPGVDWPDVVRRWRASYFATLDAKQSRHDGWVSVQSVYRDALDSVLDECGAAGFSDAEREELTLAWQRLKPWPDAVPGLTRLKRKFIIGPLSNGNVALLTKMAKHSGIPWDLVFGSDLFGHFKPDPETYLGVAKLLDLEPGQVMLGAAHNNDLANARKCGLMTGFFPRPTEYGPHQKRDYAADQEWDVVATDLEDMATKLGV